MLAIGCACPVRQQWLACRSGGNESRQKLISFGTEMYSRGLDKDDELDADRLPPSGELAYQQGSR